jgi:hypothetical protein
MLDEMRVNDEQLDSSDIRQLENADEIAHFFAKLRYDVDIRRTIPLDATAYANTQDLKMQIRHHELIATDTEDEDIRIYLFEVRSVTAKLRNELARGFLKTNDAKVLLVLTADYEDIEFVYLERSDPQKTRRKGLSLKITIRPIPLTVNRLKPDSVALRVLKRFTFTEEDSDYQWEKLRSAYMLAEWSEEYFNNRALFSDYYLKERLTDPRITSEWNEDVKPIGREVFRHLSSARKNYTRKTEDVIRKGLFEPTFKLLGFDFTEKKPGSSSAEEADYLLYAPDNKEQPIAAVLTYVWNRNLDDVDESRELEEDKGGTPFEIPGAMVVSLLEAQVAPWMIVTNGKLWRLYSSTASNKATNYYEIDLEEAIAANDQITALKYWWLMFRREAFTGFLDELLKNSADYAKELGDRLKDRVFVEIFPQFAKGFIADMRAQGVKEADIDLDTVFSGTMTFLYRLMFTLYAESLELVPINEVQGYRELSMYRMKGEIADNGGTVLDESPDKLRVQYKANSTDLYGRLSQLFTVIDEGSDDLNMPTYNGGLFSQETDSGKFLASYGIPDRFLALGLDRLTRDIDTKTQALAFIDFKSLGVRQLGSIYEGLLEFKLKIAREPLAVTKEKGKEVYQPAKKVKKPLATLAKGEVYLENDKQERKATGSYYTPDYIVKYIVRHTVGPVLDRKFAELESRLHNAQKGYRDYAKLVEARRKSSGKEESPAVYWNNPEMQNLVDDCLNVRVLDPAMGSGHFLVEVVDYTSNRLIDFLNGWTENPVWNFIDQTRQDILDDMERQHVSIDSDRLTRVSLLKRAVLKRCIYGVDLNQMAVELAKVSLWLDAFTLGAPLSFLDHHLKHGNSLIGARVAEVQEALKGQQTLFSQNKFAGVMLATDLMRQVSYLSDNTIEQTRKSAQAYRDARDHLAPYKRVLDVYTSRWFGNAPIAGKRGSQGTDITIDFLQRNDTQAWLEDPRKPENRLPADDYMKAGLIAKTALNAAEEKHFFHWELEFPEVFFAPSKPGGQDVQLKKDGGFDAVVGNPPYGRYGLLSDQEKDFIRDGNLAFGSADTAEAFMSFVPKITASNRVGMIVPKVFTYVVNWSGIREQLRFSGVTFIADVSQAFPDVLYEQVIYGAGYSENVKIGVATGENIVELHDAKLENFTSSLFPIYLDGNNEIIFDTIQQQAVKLGEVYEYWYGKGGAVPKLTNSPTAYKVVQGRDIARYTEHDNQAIYLSAKNLSANEIDTSKKRKLIVQDIVAHVTKPIPRIILMATLDDEQRLPLNTVTCVAEIEHHKYSLEYCLAVLNSNFCSWYVYHFIFNCAIRTMHFMPGYIERTPIPRIDFTTSADERERLTGQITGAYSIGDNAGVLKRVQEVLGANQSDVAHDVLAHLAQRMIDLNKEKQAEVGRFLAWLEDALTPPAPSPTRSALVEGELKSPSPLVESKSASPLAPRGRGDLGVRGQRGSLIDTFTGKTIIQGYLGDYQKSEGETSWDDFLYRLHQNRNRFAVSLSDVEGEIQIEFEKSLETLIPIKRDLARTDALIDKIVYRLYGLTDAEIELIERPQYEQALADAKAQVVGDEKIDDEEKIEKIAEGILPAAKRFFDRVEPHEVEAVLDSELPNWRSLPPDAPVFLLTGDYNLRSLPEHMDFSSSVIPYTKAVEVVLHKQVFEPFRNSHSDGDCRNSFLQAFMRGEKDLTLGSYMIILSSSRETALRNFMGRSLSDVEGLITILNDEAMRDVRNKAAHDEVLTRDEARQARMWALGILGMV